MSSGGKGRKRAGNGTGNSTSTMQQPHQVRQGSSFWTCPACGTVVHIALVSFHLSSCPVVAVSSASAAPAKVKPLSHPPREERQEHETGQGLGSPEFVSASTRKRGFPQKKSLWEEEQEDVSEEEQLQSRASSPPLFMETGGRGGKSYHIPGTPNPETPIQEGRERMVVGLQTTASPLPMESTKRDSTPDARKRLFDDWGQRFSPEPELVEHLSPVNAAADASPSSADPQAKKAKVMNAILDEDEPTMVVDLGFIDSGSVGHVADVEMLPFVGSIQDSQQERQEGVIAQQAFEESEETPRETGKNLEGQQQQLRCDNHCSLETRIEMRNGVRVDDGVSPREVELENALHELREKCSGMLLRETELQRALQVKNEECEQLRRREQELQTDLFSVKGLLEKTLQDWREVVQRGQQKTASETRELSSQLPTQTYKEDGSMATQLLSSTSNNPVSCSSSPRAVKDELPISRPTNVNCANLTSDNLVTGHNLHEADIEEQATQLIADNVSPACSPCMPDADQNRLASTESRGVSCPGSNPLFGADGESFPSQCPARKLFDGGPDLLKEEGLKGDLSKPLQSSSSAVLPPYTPGKALKSVDGYEKSKEDEENGNANLHTGGYQRAQGAPGGPMTPENFAVLLGKQEKGLISEMLNNFPPAQGIETQHGIDPFDDHFLETGNRTVSDVPSSVSKDPTPIQDVHVIQRDIDQESFQINEKVAQKVDRILSQNEYRPASPQASEDSQQEPASPQASEDSEQELVAKMRPQKKRRKAALVIDSESDGDSGNESIDHDVRQPSPTSVGDSWKGADDGMSSGVKIGELKSDLGRQASNLAEDSHPDPIISIMQAISRDRSLDLSRPSSPTIKELFGIGEEENGPGISAGGSRKRIRRLSSGNSPDLIIEALSRDRSWDQKVFSPHPANVILSSDEAEDICEGSRGSGKQGKRRRLVRLQESIDGDKSPQPDPDFEGTKETDTKVARRSERLRNVYVSASKQNDFLSQKEARGDSEGRRHEGLGTSDHDGSISKPHVLDDDDDADHHVIDLNSDSDDDQPSPAFRKYRKDKANQRMRGSAAQKALFGNKDDVDEDDDIDTDDSDFINDDPESDVDASSSIAVDEISESGEESENEGSSSGKNSSGERKKYKWEYEGDMLAALANDKDLCCRGLCALFRRQEEDEKIWSLSKYKNYRGFSKFDSVRASKYSSFLMGEGDLSGPVVKTAKELDDEFSDDPVVYCSDKCIHYSKQLFDIYQNNEDAYFPEPYVDPLA